MGLAVLKRLGSWLVPEGLILVAAVLALELDRLREAVRALAGVYPYAVFGLGVLLALRFQRSRLVFALLVLAAAEWVLTHPTGGPAGRFISQTTALLLPLNLAAITLMTERGTFTRPGLVRFALLLVQAAGVAAVARFAAPRGAALVGHPLLPAAWFEWTPLAPIPFLASVAALALTGAGLVFQSSPTNRGFLWALVAAFLGLNAPRSGPADTVYLATAGLILVVAMIEASYLMAYQDGLTGLPARRALTEALQRLGGRYTVAMVDVDHFKRLNDRYGHDVGDQVLKMVAAKLARAPGGGRAYRYGGEEFALLYSGRAVEECLPDLEALRKDIEETSFTIRRRLRPRRKPARANDGRTRQRLTVTVSIGAAEPDGRRKTPEQVIQAADQALYRAKEAGRNRVRT
ncbi:MAG TPA: GGDEF domain-containing protein [Gemmatimonadales bacterium]|nr:GGDEF domain-containing protein [Gemmatimonadales bacterium]